MALKVTESVISDPELQPGGCFSFGGVCVCVCEHASVIHYRDTKIRGERLVSVYF